MSIRARIVGLSVVALAVLGALAACSPVMLINAITPTSGFLKTADVGYLAGNKLRQRLDVYQPTQTGGTDAANKLRSVVVFFYGGAWQESAFENIATSRSFGCCRVTFCSPNKILP